MKRSKRSSRRGRRRIPPDRRVQLLAAFERSDLSAAAFARKHGIGYSTFCGWRQRRPEPDPAPGFVQVELSEVAAPIELVVEVGAHARLRITSVSQMELAATLLQRINASKPC